MSNIGKSRGITQFIDAEKTPAQKAEDEALAKRLKRVRFEKKTTALSQFARETFLSGRTGIEPILGRRDRSLAAAAARGPKRT